MYDDKNLNKVIKNFIRARKDSVWLGIFLISIFFILAMYMQLGFILRWESTEAILSLLKIQCIKPAIATLSVLLSLGQTLFWRAELLDLFPEMSPSLIRNEETRVRYWRRTKSYLLISNAFFTLVFLSVWPYLRN